MFGMSTHTFHQGANMPAAGSETGPIQPITACALPLQSGGYLIRLLTI